MESPGGPSTSLRRRSALALQTQPGGDRPGVGLMPQADERFCRRQPDERVVVLDLERWILAQKDQAEETGAIVEGFPVGVDEALIGVGVGLARPHLQASLLAELADDGLRLVLAGIEGAARQVEPGGVTGLLHPDQGNPPIPFEDPEGSRTIAIGSTRLRIAELRGSHQSIPYSAE